MIAIAAWIILVSQIAGLCRAASRGDKSLKEPACYHEDGCDGTRGTTTSQATEPG